MKEEKLKKNSNNKNHVWKIMSTETDHVADCSSWFCENSLENKKEKKNKQIIINII